ncbi:MAG: purine-nucleoside phosphorylase [Clostridia bacterium]|nr:purine-nucleoside phosphorylase [Clostridia bacterium]
MNEVYTKLTKCFEQIRKKTDFVPSVALVLGSGLGNFGNLIDVKCTVDYSELENFPISTVAGHNGRFLFGYIKNVPVVCMQGRVHYYEGYKMTDVVMPIRLMGMLGAKKLILTNAAGGINKTFKPGTLMAITDHISSFVPSALIGQNIDELGVRFPDMTSVYSKKLTEGLKRTAEKNNVPLREGVYIQFTGPAYETPAEINMARTLGADAVGMSTAVEAMAARHMGLEVCAVSCISNMAAGLNKKPLTHEEVKETADMVADQFQKLIYNFIADIENEEGATAEPKEIQIECDCVNVYTDGACKGNPGPGGYGIVIVSGDKETKLSKGFFNTTNNRMELLAAITALEAIGSPKKVTLYSDSKYLIDGMTKSWAKNWKKNNWIKSDKKKALNTDLWDKMLSLEEKHTIEYVWVKGHNGHEYNEICDKLAVEAAENPTENDVVEG